MSSEGYVLFEAQTGNNLCLPICKWVKTLKERDLGVAVCVCLFLCVLCVIGYYYSIPSHDRTLFDLEREGKLDVLDNKNKPGGYYTK